MPAPLSRLLPLALLLATAPAMAQAPVRPVPEVPAQRVTFTPFGGYQFGWTRTLDATLIIDGVERQAVYEDRSEGGSTAGLRMSLPLRIFTPLPSLDGVSLVAAVAFSRGTGGYTIATVRDGDAGTVTSTFTSQPTANVMMAKLGVGLRLPMALPADLTLAPSVVRIAPRHGALNPLHRTGPTTYPGLNIGLDVDLPTRIEGLSFQVAAEDNVLYANSELVRRVDRHYAFETGGVTRSRFPRTPSHVGLLRAGVSVHF